MPGSALSTLYWVFHLVSAVLKDVHSLGWYRQAGLSVFGERKALERKALSWERTGSLVTLFVFSAAVTEYPNLDGLQINKQRVKTGFVWFIVLGTRKSKVKWLQLMWAT